MFRMVIADADELLALRMRVLISRTPGVEVVGTAHDVASALDLVRRTRPDVALVDTALPPLDGRGLIEAIRTEMPEIWVMALAAEVLESTVQSAFAAGALAFLSKDGATDCVAAGLGWFTPADLRDPRTTAAREVPIRSNATRRLTLVGG